MSVRSTPTALQPARVLAAAATVCFLGALTSAGCGGSAERQPTGQLDVSTLDGAEAELSRAEASVAQALGDTTLLADATQTAVAADEPQGQPTSPQPVPPQKRAEVQAGGGQPPPSTCEAACDALASMRRAAERVCVLDAGRCAPARARVERAAERVKARCSECE